MKFCKAIFEMLVVVVAEKVLQEQLTKNEGRAVS